jgi:uncharacterized protein (DUF1800 family)
MGVEEARHLLGRAGFGGNPREVAALATLDRATAVERLLVAAPSPTVVAPPDWVHAPFPGAQAIRAMPEEARRAFFRMEQLRAFELRAWWMEELVATPAPLAERMTLFWHGHFATSVQKVRIAAPLYRQNRLFREHALGSFATLLAEVARDPAMLVYLDAPSNRAGRPNENFARELMELFTLGEGRYTEADVRDAARAFTGWSLDPATGGFVRRPALHDGGVKSVLGHTGRLTGDDVLAILLAQPATAEFIVGKLWREFVSPEPDSAEVRRIAARFRETGYDIRTAVRELLLAPAFWSPAQRGTLVKSPVDLLVGAVRQLNVDVPDAAPLAAAAAQLGQVLFAPPNVRGWPGGESWINAGSLLARKQFLERLFRAEEMPGMLAPARFAGPPQATARERVAEATLAIRMDPAGWMTELRAAGAPGPEAVLLAVARVEPASAGTESARAVLRQLVLDPAYQVK